VGYPDTSAHSGKAWGWAVVWLAAVAGAALVLLMTARYGAGISPDSAIYLSAARSLAEGHGLWQFTGEPLVRWAPGYPTVLGVAAAVGLDLPAAARWLNAALFAALIVAAGAWIRRHVRDPRLGAVALAAVVLSPALTRVSVYVWSEPLFLLLALLCLLDLESFDREGRRGLLARAALWAAAATLTRYAGVSLLAPGLWVALTRRQSSPKRRLVDATLFKVVVLAPLAAWLVRNWLVAGSPFGEHTASSYSVPASVWLALEQISRWLAPPLGAAPVRVALAVVVLAGVAWALARRAGGARGAEVGPRGLDGDAAPWPLAPAAVWVVAYAALVVAWTSISAVEQINERYLSPLYLPLVVMGACALVALARAPRRGLPGRVAVALMLLWLPYPAAHTALRCRGYLATGVGGYEIPAWRDSELARLLRAHPELQPLYSDAPDAVYALAGAPARFSPRRTYYNSPQPAAQDLARVRAGIGRAPNRRGYLAWFTTVERPFLYSVADLESVFTVERRAACADGALYVLEPR
jgi:hypothetical protein